MKNSVVFLNLKRFLYFFSSILGRKTVSHTGVHGTSVHEGFEDLHATVHHYEALAQKVVEQADAHGMEGLPQEHATSHHAVVVLNTGHHEAINKIKHYASTHRALTMKALHTDEEALAKVDDETHNHEISHVSHDHHLAPVHGLIKHPFFFWGIITLLVGLQMLVNFNDFQHIAAGGNHLASMGWGICFVLCQTWSAGKLGSALHHHHRSNIIVFLLLTFLFCGFIVGTRWHVHGEHMITQIFYLVINLAFAALTMVLSFFRTKHHEPFSFHWKHRTASAQVEKIKHHIGHPHMAHQKVYEAIEQRFEAKAHEKAKNVRAEIAARIACHHSHLAQLNAHEHECLEQISMLHQKALTEYKHQNAHEHTHHPLVKRGIVSPTIFS